MASVYRSINFKDNVQKIDFTVGFVALEYFEEKEEIDGHKDNSKVYWSSCNDKIAEKVKNNLTENYNDPEEKVRAEFWAELIYKYDYPANRIKVEVSVPDRVPTDRADIVVFSDDECKRPYIVVECKKDGVTII